MKNAVALADEKKLALIYRVEPGCLGPNGASHIEGFCDFAQKEIEQLDAAYVLWTITPRHNKSLPEMQYSIGSRNISREQAERYAAALQKNLDEFESHLVEKLADLINAYMGQ